MKITELISDRTVLKEIGERLARIRLNRNLTQAEMAAEAGISKRTVERLEAGESVQFTSLIRLLRSLGILSRFDSLIPEPIASPLAQLKLQSAARRRASSKSAGRPSTAGWKWGDEE